MGRLDDGSGPELAGTPRPVVLWVVISVLGLLGCLPAMMSPMAGDDPRQPKIPTLLVIFCMATFPIACWVSVGISAVLAARDARRACWYVLCLPLVNIVVGGIAIIWIRSAVG
jgi:hypothetical protein